MRRQTKYIVVHCSATPPTSNIGADEIDDWHRARGFDRIGYHAVICRDGSIEFGRPFDDVGAHVKGHNWQSVGVCMIGGVDANGKPENNFDDLQFRSLTFLVGMLIEAYPNAELLGHRDLSPDLNGDGIITSDEWLKECPCFDVADWYNGE